MAGLIRRIRADLHPGALVAVVAFLAFGALGCVHVHSPMAPPPVAKVKVEKVGPPPHAPAHGYRHKHEGGVELVFDQEIGVYVVIGWPNHYHDGQRYYRRRDGVWQVSLHLDRGWTGIAVGELPSGLRAKQAKRKHKRGHGPPAKHRD